MGSFFEGEEKQTSETETKQQQRVVLPDYLQQPIEDLVGRIGDVSMTPYTPYGGERVAGFNQDQLAAFEGVRGMQGAQQPFIDQAQQLALQSAQGVTPEDITRFMNPYQQQVTDIGKREALRDFDVQLNQIQDQMMNIGAFGGSRTGVAEGAAREDISKRLSDLQITGSRDAYDRALGTSLANVGLQQAGVGNILGAAGAAQDIGFRDISALQTVGSQQQGLTQAGLDVSYGDFLQEQARPYENVQFASSQLGPLAQLMAGQNISGTSSTTSTQTSDPSTFSKIASVASLGMGFGGGPAAGTMPSMMGQGGDVYGSLGGSQLQTFGGGQFGGGYSPTNAPGLGGGISWYAKGGLVKDKNKYAKGGLIDYAGGGAIRGWEDTPGYAHGGKVFPEGTPLKFVEQLDDYLKSLRAPETTPETTMGERLTGGAANILNSLLRAPSSAIVGAGRGTREGIKSLSDFLGATPTELRERKEGEQRLTDLADAIAREEAAAIVEPSEIEKLFEAPEDIPEILEAAPEDKSVDATKTLLDTVVREAGLPPVFTPSRAPAEAKKKRFSSDDWLRMSAAIAQAPAGKGGFHALGAGVDALLDARAAAGSARVEGAQQDFENTLKLKSARQYARQNDLQERRLMFQEEKLPLEQAKLQAEVNKLNREAIQDPYLQRALKLEEAEAKSTPESMREGSFEERVRSKAEALRRLDLGTTAPDGGPVAQRLVFDPKSGQLVSQ